MHKTYPKSGPCLSIWLGRRLRRKCRSAFSLYSWPDLHSKQSRRAVVLPSTDHPGPDLVWALLSDRTKLLSALSSILSIPCSNWHLIRLQFGKFSLNAEDHNSCPTKLSLKRHFGIPPAHYWNKVLHLKTNALNLVLDSFSPIVLD